MIDRPIGRFGHRSLDSTKREGEGEERALARLIECSSSGGCMLGCLSLGFVCRAGQGSLAKPSLV